MAEQTNAGIRGISTVGIPVSDQHRALAFYRDILGFEVRVDAPVPQLGSRWIMLAPPGADVSISLVATPDSALVGVETGIRFSSPDAEATYAALTANDVTVGEFMRWPGVPPMFAANDPDGNRFEVVEE
ncbi:VOC family protein [Leifsonia sp. NPDC058248]|uniref:VOC family protein n=1 Tax=Leifsonia sp. NPDC058248 TaxID=3346402 RepID=UPI0036DB700C